MAATAALVTYPTRERHCDTRCLLRSGVTSHLQSCRTLSVRSVPDQVEFMRRQRLAYEAVAGAEYEALKPELVRVQEAQGNAAFANEIKQPASRDAFFKARAHSHPNINPSRVATPKEQCWAHFCWRRCSR